MRYHWLLTHGFSTTRCAEVGCVILSSSRAIRSTRAYDPQVLCSKINRPQSVCKLLCSRCSCCDSWVILRVLCTLKLTAKALSTTNTASKVGSHHAFNIMLPQIGRASCRERGCVAG